MKTVMTKYIVKDKACDNYWKYKRLTKHIEDAYKFTADELKNSAIRSRLLLKKKRYVLIPVNE